MLIVTAGGEKVLLSFTQKSPGDHVHNEQILEVLGIPEEAAEKGEDKGGSGNEGIPGEAAEKREDKGGNANEEGAVSGPAGEEGK